MKLIGTFFKTLRSKSLRYIMFRSKYELERRTGLMALKYPIHPQTVKLPTLEEWKKSVPKYLFGDKDEINVQKRKSKILSDATKRVLQGEVCFFSHEWKDLGLGWDYMTNPDNGYKYDVTQHWTKVDDYNETAGDIKYVWEPSRFSFLYSLVRDDYHNGEDHSAFVIGRIMDWIDKNPVNCGPNYKCSQEISLRVLNWVFALYYYRKSIELTEERWKKIIQSIYWQIDHVYKNINFSRIAVRNNHAITETLTLYLIGLLFPQMPGAAKWKKNGKRWFEQEIEYQFEPEGSYIQQSMNYQRVVTQLLTLGIALAERNEERFCNVVYHRAYSNLNFLFQMQDENSGWLPNYGSNDGALFFQFNNADYRDYCPQLDALHNLLTGHPLYGESQEDSEWYGVTLEKERRYAPIKHNQGMCVFLQGGYFVVRDKERMVVIRCGGFKGGTPTDLMHIDLWKKGENVLMDGGSYKYNTDEKWKLYFAGTESANSVMLDDIGQKTKGPRFMWFNPSRIIEAGLRECKYGYVFEGSIETFRSLSDGILLHRKIRINKDLTDINVTDVLDNKPIGLTMRQLWHTNSKEITFESDGEKIERTGWYSNYYGLKEVNQQIEFTTKGNRVTTRITI